MSRIKELITNSLKYYDFNQEKYSKLFNKFKYYSIVQVETDIEHDKILFFDKDKQLIFESKYEILGIYYVSSQIWAWSWSIPNLNKNLVYTTRKILNYGLDIIPSREDIFIKAEIITSRFRISNEIQLDIHAAIASYISKKPMIFKLIYNPATVEKPTPILSESSSSDKIYFIYLLTDNL
jgi:hypothetical protein